MSVSRPWGVAAVVLLLAGSVGSTSRARALPPIGAQLSSRSPVVPRPPVRLPEARRVDASPSRIAPTAPDDAQCPQWWGLALSVGWRADDMRSLDVVLHRESRCDPSVWNEKDPMGGSRGLAQVNGSWTRWLREKGVLDVKEDLFEPRVNLIAALEIYRYGVDRYGFGWGPWGYRYVEPYRG